MAETNFRIFNEENAADKTYNDSEYEQATQRLGGVTPGMALSRLHNKLYLQTSVMAKAIADFLVKQGYDCYDNQATDITANLENAIKSFNASVVSESITAHNADTDAHTDFTGATADKAGVRGMVPAPAAGDEGKFLCADGTFKVAKMTTLELVNLLYPVGIIAEFTNDTDPNNIWPGTTWSKMDAGRVLVAAGTYKEGDDTYTYNLGDKGGEAKHQLTTDELPIHAHNVSGAISKHYHYQYAAISTGARTDAGINISETQYPAPVGWASGHYESYNITGVDTPATLGKTSDATVSSASILTQETGDNQRHENRQPYKVVCRWYRSA